MTLLFLESFDHHGSSDTNMNDTLTRKASNFGGTWENETGVGEFGVAGGTNALADEFRIDFDSASEIIIGFALKFRELNTTVATDPFVRIYDSAGAQIAQMVRSQPGFPRMLDNPSNRYDANAVWRPFMWNYFEIRILAGTDNSNGELEMHMNGKQVLSEIGVDTFSSAGGVGRVQFDGSDHFDHLFDNIYILNTLGSVNNDFLGEIQVETLFPNAAGTTTAWSVTGAATNHEATDDNPFDDDTSYVSTSATSDKDTYNFDNLTSITQNIVGVQMLPNGKKQGTGTREIAPVIRSGSTDYDQTTFNLTTSYDYYPTIVEQDPDTGSAWTASGVDSAEFGFKVNV